MDPITTFMTAIKSGCNSISDTGKIAYQAIKMAVKKKFGNTQAIDLHEANPDSSNHRQYLEQALASSDVQLESVHADLAKQLLKTAKKTEAGGNALGKFIVHAPKGQVGVIGDYATVQGGINFNFFNGRANAATDFIGQKIEEEVEKLCKSRFFAEFDRVRFSLEFGERLANGNLSGGPDRLRGLGLAWCSRILSFSDKIDLSEQFLGLAKTLGDCSEVKIAEAFVLSQREDKSVALHALASIDCGASRSAALMIVAHHDGAEGAIQWMEVAGYHAGNLNPDGKYFLLIQQLHLGHWHEAEQTVDAVSEIDFHKTPALHHLVGVTKLIATVPAAYRVVVLAQVPFDSQGFPLASDANAMDARRTAHKHFLHAAEAAINLECPCAARISDEYAIWLELRDPSQTAHGKNRLANKLRDPNTRLSVVHLALQFGLKLDLDVVERDIDRHIAINGGMTMEAAIARYALSFTKPTPEEVANYIVRHHDQLASHIDPKLMYFRQIEMFSCAGLISKAKEIFEQLIKNGISPEEEKTLRLLIVKAEGNNPVEFRKTQYETTGALDDLINLVMELEERLHWDDLCEYGNRLFNETRSLRDAERLVKALTHTNRSEAIVEFLKTETDFLLQSKDMQMSYAWGLYHEGALLESRTALEKLKDDESNPNYRALQVNLNIAMGDWGAMSAYAASEYRNRNKRSAQDLMGAAQLALHMGSPHARDLVFEAAEKAGKDATILAAAYMAATQAGWEDDPKVFQWLEKAAELAGDEGPLHRMSFREILDRKPEWDRRTSEIERLLVAGEMPIFLAAQSLNKTLIGLTLFPAFANLSERDLRRRIAIPAYSGKREPIEFVLKGKTVALDATALLTLSFFNILDITLDIFETVHIPHSTLMWLFEERQKAAYQQPSRIAKAHLIRDLLATDKLEKLTPSTVASSDLAAQVGDELAALIAEAEKIREGDDSQHIVVRSAPVYRVSSLMEEEADLSAHSTLLSSCLAVVEKIAQKAQVTADEKKRALAYLKLQEKPWTNQPNIADRAVLYLDSLAVTYLLHLGLLGRIVCFRQT